MNNNKYKIYLWESNIKKIKIFQYHRIAKFSNNLRKLDFLSVEKISKCSRFVNKDISQS